LHPAGSFQRLFGAGMPIVRVGGEQCGSRWHGSVLTSTRPADFKPGQERSSARWRTSAPLEKPARRGTERAVSLGSFGGKTSALITCMCRGCSSLASELHV
jgi:hypothetical protein